MTQFEFDKLIEKYMAGDCDPAEERLIEEWSERQAAASPFPLTAEEEVDTNKRLKKRIDTHTKGAWGFLFRLPFYRLGIAACLLSIIAYSGWILLKKPIYTEGGTSHNKTASFELSNTTNVEQEFNLKDGSTITLKPQSYLKYLENFGVDNRIVFLKGEGYFQIKRDTSKPFYVYAGNLVTKVLGTKFIVKAYDDKKSEVVVTSGKVMVYENIQGKVSKTVVLTPNQKVNYVPTEPVLTPVIVDVPILVHPIEKVEDFDFKQTALSVVLKRLKTVYDIDILIKNKNIEQCHFTGNLNGLSLSEQLDLICKTIDAKYQKYETAIWIDGEGCN
jgi:ferric-dicitrate binding protein FerR (iron transport regulator)